MRRENTLKKTQINLPPLFFRGGFEPETLDAEKRTIMLRWSTGEKVLRGGFFTDPFYEELSLSPDSVRMNRLKNGAPLLNTHSNQNVLDQIGVVEDAWLENGSGFARVRFSERADVAPIFQDVKAGIIRNVSVGYRVYRFQDVSGENDKLKTFRATDWEPMELSMVPVGADSGASVRSHEKDLNACEVVERTEENKNEETLMKDQNQPQRGVEGEALRALPVEGATRAPIVNPEAIRKETLEQERKRTSEITQLTRKFGMEEAFSRKLIESDVPVDEARRQILDKLAERSDQNKILNQVSGIEVTRDEADVRRAGAVEALMHRYDPKVNQLTEKAHPFAGMSLLRLAEEMLLRNHQKVSGLSKMELTKRAFLSTSDFPEILSAVANKTLRQAYDMAPQTFRPFVRQVFNADFKPVSRVQLSEAPKLEKVNQSGEFKYGSMSDSAEKYNLATFGKIIAINRQVIIDDDLEAMTRIPALFGRSAADLESDLVYGVITGNAAMSDGITLFHANHSNLGVPAAPGEAGFGEAREKMRTQTGLQKGKDKQFLNVTARYLIVPAALETASQKQLTAITANVANSVNVFSGAYVLITEPRLDADSKRTWYMAADPSQIDTIEIAYLQGQAGVYTETEQGFDIDGIKIKARLDVGVKAIDHRGLFKNPGV